VCFRPPAGILIERNWAHDSTVKVRKTASFFEFSLCLSRACLGKMIVFIYKWLKNAVFRRASVSIGKETRLLR
jgi:hypothetical protein